MKRTLSTLLLAVLSAAILCLTGCGGGAADMPFGPPPVCTPRVVIVDLLGDSTEVGAYSTPAGFRVADPTPAQELQKNMDAEFGPGAVVVNDLAVSGTRATQAPHVVADVIVANYGINDMRTYGESLDDYIAAMKAIGATLIETQNPIVDGYQWNEDGYVAAAKSLGLPIADVHSYVSALTDWPSLLSDGIHPLPPLYVEIDDEVLAPAVALQVAPLRCMR